MERRRSAWRIGWRHDENPREIRGLVVRRYLPASSPFTDDFLKRESYGDLRASIHADIYPLRGEGSRERERERDRSWKYKYFIETRIWLSRTIPNDFARTRVNRTSDAGPRTHVSQRGYVQRADKHLQGNHSGLSSIYRWNGRRSKLKGQVRRLLTPAYTPTEPTHTDLSSSIASSLFFSSPYVFHHRAGELLPRVLVININHRHRGISAGFPAR